METDGSMVNLQEEAVVHEWFDGYFSHEFTRLAMGRLFGDLLTRMEHKARAPSDPLKLAIYSCHDVSRDSGIADIGDLSADPGPPFLAAVEDFAGWNAGGFESFRPALAAFHVSHLHRTIPRLVAVFEAIFFLAIRKLDNTEIVIAFVLLPIILRRLFVIFIAITSRNATLRPTTLQRQHDTFANVRTRREAS